MNELSAPFAPDWVLPPGATILDISEERGWTQSELAQRLGYSEKHVSQLVHGKVSITPDSAQRLERVLGSTLNYWLVLEANYQKHKARLEASQRHANWIPWLDEIPVKDLMGNGLIPKVRNDAKNKPGIVEACLCFFGVASPDEWRNHYGRMEMAFRRTREEQSDVGAISAWLRLGEQVVEQDVQDVPNYDRTRFEKALHDIRNLTREAPTVFGAQMRKLLRDAGVLLALVPAIPRAHVSGVARWINGTRPLIQMSLYGKTNDKFWFTFFHEAAHILLHAENKTAKQSIFLDDPNASHSTDSCESEANQWARDMLIPQQYSKELPTLLRKEKVEEFSQRIGIHPGIVVGRLQHDKIIDPSWMNDLKKSLRFKKAAS